MIETLLIVLCLVTFTGCSTTDTSKNVDADKKAKIETPVETKDEVKEEVVETVEEVVDGNLTVDNCDDLKNVLNARNDDSVLFTQFVKDYVIQTIEFDGAIDLVGLIPGKSSRFEMLLRAGDYDANSITGPTLKIKDFSSSDDGVLDMINAGTLINGQNIHIVAKVYSYDEVQNILFLDLVSITTR